MQRLGQTVVFVLVFCAAALVLYLAAAPHLLPPAPAPTAPVSPPSAENAASDSVSPSSAPALPAAPIVPPRTAPQREADSSLLTDRQDTRSVIGFVAVAAYEGVPGTTTR